VEPATQVTLNKSLMGLPLTTIGAQVSPRVKTTVEGPPQVGSDAKM